jgi:hypothetical protein
MINQYVKSVKPLERFAICHCCYRLQADQMVVLVDEIRSKTGVGWSAEVRMVICSYCLEKGAEFLLSGFWKDEEPMAKWEVRR